MRVLVYIFCFLCFKSIAQTFEPIDFKNSLSQNSVLTIEQDDTGFIWIGTADGLNRFDGMSVRTFRFSLNETNCICSNEVMDIVNDQRGNLWIATSNCLNKLDLKDYSFSQFNKSKGLSGNYITQINLIDSQLSILTDNGLDLLNLETEEIVNVEIPDQHNVKNVTPILHDNILITTGSGLYIYNNDEERVLKLEDFYDLQYKKENIVRSFVDSSHLFVAYKNEIVVYNLKSAESRQLYGYEFLDTRDISMWNGSIWFATSKGLMTFHCGTQEFRYGLKEGLPEGVALTSFLKSDTEIWFSIGTGILTYRHDGPLFRTLKVDESQTGLSGHNKVWHLCNEKDNIIISTEYGISFLSPSGEIESLSEKMPMPLDIQNVSNVSRDDHNIWICTFDAGIYHVDLGNMSVVNFSSTKKGAQHIGSNTVRHSLVLDKEVLFSTDNGFYIFNKATQDMEEVIYSLYRNGNSLSKKATFSLKDSFGRLWIGTQNGIFVRDSAGHFTHYSTMTIPALSNNRIRNISQRSDSIFLIGTSSGLNLFNYEESEIEYVDVGSGLDNDVIYSLEIDEDGEIWVSTNKGISLITNEQNVLNFNVYDGLQGSEFNTNASAQSKNGEFFFGGLYGISRFYPKKVKEPQEIKSPIITKIEILPHEDERGFILDYPLKAFYEFAYSQCNFIISFTSINYTNPENNIFYYKLEGYNHEWIKIDGDPEVQFMNLDQGTYDFKVRTALRNGELSKNLASLRIKIYPAFYNSFLFRLLGVVLLLILGTIAYRARIRAVEKSNIKLQEIVEDQTQRLKTSNNIQRTFLKEVPEPLVILNTKNEVTVENDLYKILKSQMSVVSKNDNQLSQQLDQFILAGAQKISEERLSHYESELAINEKLLQLKFNRMVVDEIDYGTAVLLRDMTSIKNAEETLKKNEFLFRSYFEKSPIGIIYIVDPQKPISNCNAKFCEMIGMEKSEVLSKTMMDLTFNEDLEKDIERFTLAALTKQRYLFEPNKRLICPKGSMVMTEAHLTFIYDEEDKYQYMFGLIHNVTEQRENQEKLIRARTQLIQSEKLAALGQITAGVAHEINNPVNFIYNGVNNLKTLIKALRREQTGDVELIYKDIDEMISAVEDGANRTAEIVKSLRLFTREDVKSQVHYDIIIGLESTITLLSNKLKDSIHIERSYPFKEYPINCYPGQLNQVFMNVILNAIEAIETIDNFGTIEISIVEKEKYVDVIIADTGSGIKPAISKMIYEPFFSTKGPKNGTGLGLSISQTIIDKHNGSIAFIENVPKGTKCIISLPI